MTPILSLNSVTSRSRVSFLLLTLLILCKFSTLAQASGVFEFELVELQRLDSIHSNNNDRTNTNKLSPIRILVCLKEAFTSQLDGPCTFGNASLTINQHQTDAATNTNNKTLVVEINDHQINSLDEATLKPTTTATNQTTDIRQIEHRKQQQQQIVAHAEGDVLDLQQQRQSLAVGHRQQQANYLQQQQQQGSPLTNVVRILFTFRWTKSFTIILTAEQIAPNELQQPSVNSASLRLDANHYQASRLKLPNGGVNQTATAMATNQLELVSASNRSSSDKQVAATTSSSSSSSSASLIDRHVLTENEVLPNLETNPNKPWTSRFSRSLKSSLFYRFRVFCALNYYGDGCTTFCRPRDDQFGHYNCSSTGQKVCLDGWTGPDCDKAKCRSGCNQQHGYCDRPDTCQCRPGWTGPRCDECITYPGCQNGYCLSPWQCICQQNWGGVLCDQDLNYCGSHDPCRNNGTCENVAPGRYKCHCDPEFTGVNCETNLSTLNQLVVGEGVEGSSGGLQISNGGQLTQLSAGCALNPCLNGGTCFGFNSQLIAATPTSPESRISVGDLSHATAEATTTDQLQQEKSEPPSMVSGPQLDGPHYRCQCPTGFTGDFCQWADNTFNLSTELLLNNNSGSTNWNSSSADENKSTTAAINGSIMVIDVDESSNDDAHSIGQQKNESLITTMLDNAPATVIPSTVTAQHLDMRHLISGVLVASVVGVFLAALLLTWCCLIAIEQNRFPFIQMNIIRRCDSDGDQQQQTVSTLRRVQAKIRDSLRYSTRGRIKPETKLNIDNVLKPPPSYEESNHYSERIYEASQSQKNNLLSATNLSTGTNVTDLNNSTSKHEDKLVVRGALEQEIYASRQKSMKSSYHNIKSTITTEEQLETNTSQQHHTTDNPYSTCPRHGHLYRATVTKEQERDGAHDHFHVTVPPTTIEIEYQSRRTACASTTSPDRSRGFHRATIELDKNQLKSHEHYHDYPNGFV